MSLLSVISFVLFVAFPVARAVIVLLTTFPSSVATKWVRAIATLDNDAIVTRRVASFIFKDVSVCEYLLHSEVFDKTD